MSGALELTADLLERCDEYLDAVLRRDGDATTVGPFSLFLPRGPWPGYARPQRGVTQVAAADLDALAARARRLGVPAEIEWVADLVPGLAGRARARGWDVSLLPLMVLPSPDALGHPPIPPGATLHVVTADDPLLPEVRAASAVAFAHPGVWPGPDGTGTVHAVLALADDASRTADAHTRERLRAGLTRGLALLDEQEDVVAVGWHEPLGSGTDPAHPAGASEIVGVGTVPSARRHGLAAALTEALARDALERGADLVLLSAGDDDVARGYDRLGFVRIGHAGRALLADDA